MTDLLPEVVDWWRAGHPVAVATVIRTEGSAPRSAGATLAVGPDGAVGGSVSGGCVEGAVYERAQEALVSGTPTRTRFGYSDETAFAVGLTCGGTVEVFVERVDPRSFPDLGSVADAVERGEPVAVATVVRHPDPTRVGCRWVVRPVTEPGMMPADAFEQTVRSDAAALLAAGRSELRAYAADGARCPGEAEVFVASYAPPPRLIVFGAIDFAAAMVRVGKLLGYRVTVCDARAVFATPARFPDADEVVVSWPDRYLAAEASAGRVDARTALTVLTHDPKFDIPLLTLALRLPDVGYVGAMGSRSTHTDRVERLTREGLGPSELARLRSPIGLDIGGRTPEETALSIAAEIVALRSGRSGLPLSETAGAIQPRAEPSPRRPSTPPASRAG